MNCPIKLQVGFSGHWRVRRVWGSKVGLTNSADSVHVQKWPKMAENARLLKLCYFYRKLMLLRALQMSEIMKIGSQ